MKQPERISRPGFVSFLSAANKRAQGEVSNSNHFCGAAGGVGGVGVPAL